MGEGGFKKRGKNSELFYGRPLSVTQVVKNAWDLAK